MLDEKQLDLSDFRSFEQVEFYAKQVVEGFITGLHKSPFHGFSVEFSEHRIYNPGESTRNIDWKLYGRTDRLYIKQYEEETNLRCHLLIDSSGSMYYPLDRKANLQEPNKILFATTASLALMNLFRKQRDAVGLSFFGNHSFQSKAKSTYRHHRLLATEMYKVLTDNPLNKNQTKSLASQIHLLSESLPKRSLVMLFSDFFDALSDKEALFDALHHLRHGKHEVVVFWTTDMKTELNFGFEERPYQFVDIESGEKLKLNPAELMDQYQRAIKLFATELEEACLQYGLTFVNADVGKGYYPILKSYLLKRRRMYV